MSQPPKLLPCPFCGGEAEIFETFQFQSKECIACCGEVFCHGHQAELEAGGWAEGRFTHQDATKIWNTRHALQISDEMVEAASMALLGHEKRGDLAPGVDWKVDRSWTIGIVREQMRKALIAALDR